MFSFEVFNNNGMHVARYARMVLAAGVSLGLLACDQRPPIAPTPNDGPTQSSEITLVLTPGQTRSVEGMEPSVAITFADVQARNVCNQTACLAIFIPAVVLDITGESPTPLRRTLALPSALASDNVPSATTAGRVRIELTALESVFTGVIGYRATLRVTSPVPTARGELARIPQRVSG